MSDGVKLVGDTVLGHCRHIFRSHNIHGIPQQYSPMQLAQNISLQRAYKSGRECTNHKSYMKSCVS